MREFSRILYSVFGMTFLLIAVLPLLVVAVSAFSETTFMSFPPRGFTLRWLAATLTGEWLTALIVSCVIAAASSLIATVIGCITAWYLFVNSKHSALIYTALLSPITVPTVVLAVGLYLLFAPLKLVGNPVAIVLVHAALGLPFVTLVVRSALSSYDLNLDRAAVTLGASNLNLWLRVRIPVLLPSMIAGALLAFVASFDELVIVWFIGGRIVTIPKEIFAISMQQLNPTLSAASLVMMLLSISLSLIATILSKSLRDDRP